MLNVDLSNVWSQISLPDLLGEEKRLFDAHLALRNNQPDGPAFLGFLGAPDSVTAKMLHTVNASADKIRDCCEYLLVIGNTGSTAAARAAVSMLGEHTGCKLIFAGNNLSSQAWLELCRRIEGKDVCLHVVSPYGDEPEACIASRAIRWLLERRCGADAKGRIFVSALAQTPMAQMANEEGYTLLPMPQELGGSDSALHSAAFLPMAVAGIDPLALLEGAAEAYRCYDLRAFENPAWLYAGARLCLRNKNYRSEILATLEPSMEAFGRWWRQYVLRHTLRGEHGLLPVHSAYTEELELYSRALVGGSTAFETLLTTADCGKKVGVEMDWKDYDGFGCLSGKTLADVRALTLEAFSTVHADLSLPSVVIDLPHPDAAVLGELFYFFELSNALCAYADGIDAFSHAPSAVQTAFEDRIGKQSVK